MKRRSLVVFTLSLVFMVVTAVGVFAADSDTDDEGARLFRELDKDRDGRISREEWDAVDSDKNGTITPEELERFHFKGSRPYRWIDTNSDGYMDRNEFLNNFTR
jgi:Ca2+-binding EF-hand superfamily protein